MAMGGGFPHGGSRKRAHSPTMPRYKDVPLEIVILTTTREPVLNVVYRDDEAGDWTLGKIMIVEDPFMSSVLAPFDPGLEWYTVHQVMVKIPDNEEAQHEMHVNLLGLCHRYMGTSPSPLSRFAFGHICERLSLQGGCRPGGS